MNQFDTRFVGYPNSGGEMFVTFKKKRFPWTTKEVCMEVTGQLCFDYVAHECAAGYMRNNRMAESWEYVSWRCTTPGPLIGREAKRSGVAPVDFDVESYCDDDASRWHARNVEDARNPDDETIVRP